MDNMQFTPNWEIFIEGIEVLAPIGVYDEEREKKNNFIVDVFLKSTQLEATHSDMLVDTVDYKGVYDLILALMEIPCALLEKKAMVICKELKEKYPKIDYISLKIKKLSPMYMQKCSGAGVVYTVHYAE
jgi:dihydroneopterin aldolase